MDFVQTITAALNMFIWKNTVSHIIWCNKDWTWANRVHDFLMHTGCGWQRIQILFEKETEEYQNKSVNIVKLKGHHIIPWSTEYLQCNNYTVVMQVSIGSLNVAGGT